MTYVVAVAHIRDVVHFLAVYTYLVVGEMKFVHYSNLQFVANWKEIGVAMGEYNKSTGYYVAAYAGDTLYGLPASFDLVLFHDLHQQKDEMFEESYLPE